MWETLPSSRPYLLWSHLSHIDRHLRNGLIVKRYGIGVMGVLVVNLLLLYGVGRSKIYFLRIVARWVRHSLGKYIFFSKHPS